MLDQKLDQVLYRKYRPGEWSEVLGQSHIVAVLEASIKNKNFAQAYLFTGSRGTGKTSIARIFARALGTNPEDIIEIDAASNRGIDDIRELRMAVHTLPFSSAFKVYIIDEVHMLTKEAFNALLKTLEEPPAHVIFILATTERDKVPETITSRCQVFAFRKPTEKILAETILEIAKKEKFVIDQESASLIAFLAEGSFRDALSVLQKVFSATVGRTITREIVESITGAPSLQIIQELYSALIEQDLDRGYRALQYAAEHNTDMMLLAQFFLSTMRWSLMYRYSPSLRTSFEEEHSEIYVELVKRGAVENKDAVSSRGIIVMIEAVERIAFASIPSLPLELAMIEMIGIESSKTSLK